MLRPKYKHVLPAGTVKRIHVNKHIIARNLKHKRSDPVLTIQTSKGSIRAHDVQICGWSTLSDTRGQLSCGARVWVETYSKVAYT